MDAITVTVIVVLISVVLSLFAYFQRKWSFNYWQSKGIPCVKPSFFYGNIKDVGKKFHAAVPLKNIYDTFIGTGVKFCGAYFYSRPVAIILNLELMKDIMIKDFNNFTDRGMFYNAKDDPLSANVATLDGEEWKKLRRKLSPTFSLGKLKYILPTTVNVAERLNEVLKESVMRNEDEVNIKDFMLRYTADVIGTIAFGIECNSLKDPNSEFISMARAITSKQRHSLRFLILVTTFANIARKLRVKVFDDGVSSFFMNAVKNTIEYREKNSVRRNDLMDIMIDSKNQSSDEALTFNEIASNAFVFFLGGFDSTSVTLTHCLYELAMNPDVQTKARNEISETFERHDGEFTYEMLNDLKYVEQVIKETLRKYPVSSSINRFTKNDYRVSGTDHVIEKGTWVKIPVFAIHRDPQYYPDPEKFNPDRFSANETQKRPSMSWMPFGDGPRGCLGMRFVSLNMQIAVTLLLKNFEFLICSKTIKTFNYNVKRTILTSNEDIFLKIRPISS